MTAPVKKFLSHDGQVDRLIARGMVIEDRQYALEQLRNVNYYRLSGYWYSFREFDKSGKRGDNFFADTKFRDVVSLYEFDARLRTATFSALGPVELGIRASLGHELGKIDECVHLIPALLNARSQSTSYVTWLQRYKNEFARSQEDFIGHHRQKYGGSLPVWAAVEILDWGSMRYLYGFAPRKTQDAVASLYDLSAPQFESWLKVLEIVRNVCAHHGRLFNRVFAKVPKLPAVGRFPSLDAAGPYMTRAYGQLTLIQHMRLMQGLNPATFLSAALASYPMVKAVPIAHTGAPAGWLESSLWAR